MKTRKNPEPAVDLSTDDCLEIIREARRYCKASGIKNPTDAQIRRQIAYEHGKAWADQCAKHFVYIRLGIRRFAEDVYKLA